MDLPPAGATSGTQSPGGSSGIRLVSATEAVADSASGSTRFARRSTAPKGGAAPDSFSAPARYGYDASYHWLKGKLEHSQIDRRWKLRYIPIDGSTDTFGGSVVISNPTVLDGYQRGEFVEIRGALGAQPQDDQGYAPEFEVRQVKRLGS
jgi:hypothetical protein